MLVSSRGWSPGRPGNDSPLGFVPNNGNQRSYKNQQKYFTANRKKLDSLRVDAIMSLGENVRKVETRARIVAQELLDGNYTFEQTHVGEFGQEDYIYTLNKGESMQIEMDALYTEFADWPAS